MVQDNSCVFLCFTVQNVVGLHALQPLDNIVGAGCKRTRVLSQEWQTEVSCLPIQIVFTLPQSYTVNKLFTRRDD